jgi:tRNA 5-methylaminomethyl-2-thiouridine biosynthesis bifunctional protein
MKRDNQPWGPTPEPQLTWNSAGEPYSSSYDDVYYSREDGLAESHHVFLQGNGLPARWADFPEPSFCIAETGFGTGLNFLLTWQTWLQQAAPRPRLHFVSIEKFPLSRDQLARALAPWKDLQSLSEELLRAWPGRLPGQHRLLFEQGQVILDLWWEDVHPALADLASHGPVVDAWYLDGFAPAKNEAMWQTPLYTHMAALSRPGATAATFTASGTVRRGLANAGFEVEKIPGFGRKRESITARLNATGEPVNYPETPWHQARGAISPPSSVVIIGAGLAGCTVASALAQRGVRVKLLDAGTLAGAASGNEQGVLYTRLSRRHSSLTDFALQSFRHAATRYRQLLDQQILQAEADGQLCGSFHQETDSEELEILTERLQGLEDLAQVLDRQGAADLLGAEPAIGGYWYPDSGWLHPPAVCAALVDNALIELQTDCSGLSLNFDRGNWHINNDSGDTIARAPVAILCTGTDSAGFPQTDWLPLQSIRGQTSYLPATAQTKALRSAFCHKGYISPARDGRHCIGASFKLKDASEELREGEHSENLDKLRAALPGWSESLQQVDVGSLGGRVGFRCASPDYLPIVGRVPDYDLFLQTYATLRKNARQTIPEKGDYVPGLYVNTAHGSRGLSSTPLCAQLLASDICGEAPPLSSELIRALSPARFLVRDLARNRI